MRDNTMTSGLACTWVAVVDATGRTHMEARWSQPAAAVPAAVVTAAAHAA